jgi:ABC-type polysaccharide/polyol phosphate export permease
MYMAFLVTPIIWEPGSISDRIGWVVDLNPFYHLLEILRRPMLGELPAAIHWIVATAIAAVSLLAGNWMFRRYSRPLPFWI